MSCDSVPEVLEKLKPMFHQYFGTELKGTLTSDLLALGAGGKIIQEAAWNMNKPNITTLSDNECDVLLLLLNKEELGLGLHYVHPNAARTRDSFPISPYVQLHRWLRSQGVAYCTARESIGNSQILFHTNDGISAGQIEKIFVHK
ncbi:hypothetical protein BDQ17DRAFT_1430840 [Cyathus striatus]|nr:hypothetical protein BDQ17DRAFT_1430840 [Cyathus striatus]